VRNPFTRALSAYLDKVASGKRLHYRELGGRTIKNFEDYLRAVADFDPDLLDRHFRPQHININYPTVCYDAVFFLENINAITPLVALAAPTFKLEKFAPHSRDAGNKLRAHYCDSTLRLVRKIYAKDFSLFGYSEDLDASSQAPGELICAGTLVPPSGKVPLPSSARPSPGVAFERFLIYRRLVDLRLL